MKQFRSQQKVNNSFIYFQDESKNKFTRLDKLYVLSGQEDFIDEDGNPRKHNDNGDTYAKASFKEDGSVHYFIKITGNGKPYNPIDSYLNVKTSSIYKTIGKNTIQFHKVNHKVFDTYINFLRTKNISWLHNTEREMI